MVVISAILLGGHWPWSLAALSSICFALLFWVSPNIGDGMAHHSNGYSSHLYGMLFSYSLVAFSLAYFLTKIIGELREREHRVRTLQANNEKLVSVTSILTETAHELGSPFQAYVLLQMKLERSSHLLKCFSLNFSKTFSSFEIKLSAARIYSTNYAFGTGIFREKWLSIVR